MQFLTAYFSLLIKVLRRFHPLKVYIFTKGFNGCILGSKKRSCYIFLKGQKLSQKIFSTLSKKSENDNFGQHF
jgi:hypothetical protein